MLSLSMEVVPDIQWDSNAFVESYSVPNETCDYYRSTFDSGDVSIPYITAPNYHLEPSHLPIPAHCNEAGFDESGSSATSSPFSFASDIGGDFANLISDPSMFVPPHVSSQQTSNSYPSHSHADEVLAQSHQWFSQPQPVEQANVPNGRLPNDIFSSSSYGSTASRISPSFPLPSYGQQMANIWTEGPTGNAIYGQPSNPLSPPVNTISEDTNLGEGFAQLIQATQMDQFTPPQPSHQPLERSSAMPNLATSNPFSSHHDLGVQLSPDFGYRSDMAYPHSNMMSRPKVVPANAPPRSFDPVFSQYARGWNAALTQHQAQLSNPSSTLPALHQNTEAASKPLLDLQLLPSSSPSTSKNLQFPCLFPGCGELLKHNKSVVAKHMANKHSGGTFKCEVDGKEVVRHRCYCVKNGKTPNFKTVYDLGRHCLNHLGSRLSCPDCGEHHTRKDAFQHQTSVCKGVLEIVDSKTAIERKKAKSM